MKKLLLSACAGFALFSPVLGQHSKQAANAMRADDPNFAQSALMVAKVINPSNTIQLVTGYYQESFESTTFPPTGWQRISIQGSNQWVRSTAQFQAGVASAYMQYQSTAGEDWLITPQYKVTASTDSLIFYMRLAYAGYAPDSLCIKISTTDSLTSSFTKTLLKLSEGVNYPPNSTTWYRYGVSLNTYVGQNVYLAFKHFNNNGDGLYIDNIKIGTPPAAEVATSAILSPASNIGTGSYTPQATFANLGTASQSFSVTTTINPGGYTSTMLVSGLAVASTTNVSFNAWTASAGTYTLKSYTQLSGDANLLNDTLTRVIAVIPAFTNYGWSNKQTLPAGRWATGPVFANPCMSSTDSGYVYLISGADAAFANSNLNTRYNVATGTYSAMATIPLARTQITPIYVKGKIYVIGGYSGSFSPTNTNSIYDIATNTWSTGAVMPTAVGDYAAAVYKDSLIYYVGGYNGSGDVNTVQIYNIAANTWTTGTVKTGAAVAGARMGISGNKIVFVGGYSQTLALTQSAAYLGVINPSSPATITWSNLSNYPGGTSGRLGAGTALENNGLVYFAAGDPNGQGNATINSVYAYNTNTSGWEIGPNIPTGVSNINGLAGAVHNDSLYIVCMGGYNGTSVVNNNAWLNIGSATPKPGVQTSFSICANNLPTTINAYNATTYSWTPALSLSSSTVSAPVASPTTSTTYTVVMGRLYGCAVTGTLGLNVVPVPSATVSSNSPVCANSPINLNILGGSTYTWTGPAGFTDASSNPVISSASAANSGIYTVTVSASGCSDTQTINVTVVTPTLSASNTGPYCEGQTISLSSSPATSYTWSGPATFTSGIQSPSIPSASLNMAGSYTVIATIGSCTTSAMINVTVNALPTAVASASTICDGQTLFLTGTSSATSYTWTGPASFSSTVQSPSIALAGTVNAGSYILTVSDVNGCVNTVSVTAVVNPLPVVTLSLTQNMVCVNGGSFTLSGETPAGGTWNGSGVSGNSFDPSIAGTGTFVITYSYTDGNGCNATANDSMMVDACLGVNTLAKENVQVYPNPAANEIIVSLATTPNGVVKGEIINSLGQVVNTFEIKEQSGRINISTLEAGIYVLRLTSGDNVMHKSLIKN
jgi:hypothetical protein